MVVVVVEKERCGGARVENNGATGQTRAGC